VLLFSQEMPSVELGGRAVAAATGFDAHALARGEFGLHTAEGLIGAQKRLDGVPLLIDDRSGLTAEDVISTVQSLKSRYPIRFVVIDHLQKMRLGRNADKLGTAYAIGQTTSALKDAAKRLNVAVLLLAQLGRDVDRRPDPRPTLADLAYAGEADADTVALLWRPELYHPASAPEHNGKETEEAWAKRKDAWERRRVELKGKAQLVIAKRRGGPEGDVWLDFDARSTRFAAPVSYGDATGQWWEDAAQ
jgi:replicative DNA helicase